MARKPALKMYSCSTSVSMMVVAETSEEAAIIAAFWAENQARNTKPESFVVSEASTSKHRVYADGWDDTMSPYGQANDQHETVGAIFKRLEKGRP